MREGRPEGPVEAWGRLGGGRKPRGVDANRFTAVLQSVYFHEFARETIFLFDVFLAWELNFLNLGRNRFSIVLNRFTIFSFSMTFSGKPLF